MTERVISGRLVENFTRVPGLYVEDKVLKGTLIVFFEENDGLSYSKEHFLHLLRLVNRRMSNGYGIDLNIREASFFEGIYTSIGSVTVVVLRTLAGNNCGNVAACYKALWNAIRVTPDAPDIYVVHEFLHKLGLDHNDSPRSLMFYNQGGRPSRDLKTFPEEIKLLVEAYR